MSRYALPLTATLIACLAACSDAPTSPTAKPAPAKPDLGLSGVVIGRPTPVTLTLRITSQGGTPAGQGIGGTTVTFASSIGASKNVTDNGADDADARIGYYSVTMTTANWYKASVSGMTGLTAERYSFDGATKTVSAFATPTFVPMGDLAMNIRPGLYVETWFKGALAPGQTITVKYPNGFVKTITDGGANDYDPFTFNQMPSDGKFELTVPTTGVYLVCPASTPHKYYKADCVQVWANQYFVQYSADLTFYKYIAFPDNW
jgi:hypothetical protein